MRIGLLSDTHLPASGPDLPSEVYAALRGCDAILHGGDITISSVLDHLEEIAPVYAAMGNHDEHLAADPRVKALHWLTFEGHEVALLHRFEPLDWSMDRLLDRFFDGRRPAVVVFGDSHFELVEERDGVLLFNVGSATLPRNLSPRLGHVGFLTLEAGRRPVAKLVDLSGGANDGFMRTGAEQRGK
jgi:putative phosphoesterase